MAKITLLLEIFLPARLLNFGKNFLTAQLLGTACLSNLGSFFHLHVYSGNTIIKH